MSSSASHSHKSSEKNARSAQRGTDTAKKGLSNSPQPKVLPKVSASMSSMNPMQSAFESNLRHLKKEMDALQGHERNAKELLFNGIQDTALWYSTRSLPPLLQGSKVSATTLSLPPAAVIVPTGARYLHSLSVLES
jgi:hypothetical protein